MQPCLCGSRFEGSKTTPSHHTQANVFSHLGRLRHYKILLFFSISLKRLFWAITIKAIIIVVVFHSSSAVIHQYLILKPSFLLFSPRSVRSVTPRHKTKAWKKLVYFFTFLGHTASSFCVKLQPLCWGFLYQLKWWEVHIPAFMCDRLKWL